MGLSITTLNNVNDLPEPNQSGKRQRAEDRVTSAAALPLDCVCIIFSFLGTRDLASLSLVSKSMNSDVKNHTIRWFLDSFKISTPSNESIKRQFELLEFELLATPGLTANRLISIVNNIPPGLKTIGLIAKKQLFLGDAEKSAKCNSALQVIVQEMVFTDHGIEKILSVTKWMTRISVKEITDRMVLAGRSATDLVHFVNATEKGWSRHSALSAIGLEMCESGRSAHEVLQVITEIKGQEERISILRKVTQNMAKANREIEEILTITESIDDPSLHSYILRSVISIVGSSRRSRVSDLLRFFGVVRNQEETSKFFQYMLDTMSTAGRDINDLLQVIKEVSDTEINRKILRITACSMARGDYTEDELFSIVNLLQEEDRNSSLADVAVAMVDAGRSLDEILSIARKITDVKEYNRTLRMAACSMVICNFSVDEILTITSMITEEALQCSACEAVAHKMAGARTIPASAHIPESRTPGRSIDDLLQFINGIKGTEQDKIKISKKVAKVMKYNNNRSEEELSYFCKNL
ncbi:MAG: F-box protein [Verrucomicrobiota bacterium]|nr:F-box protein [Verrucomicrobiota bacterium]